MRGLFFCSSSNCGKSGTSALPARGRRWHRASVLRCPPAAGTSLDYAPCHPHPPGCRQGKACRPPPGPSDRDATCARTIRWMMFPELEEEPLLRCLPTEARVVPARQGHVCVTVGWIGKTDAPAPHGRRFFRTDFDPRPPQAARPQGNGYEKYGQARHSYFAGSEGGVRRACWMPDQFKPMRGCRLRPDSLMRGVSAAATSSVPCPRRSRRRRVHTLPGPRSSCGRPSSPQAGRRCRRRR